MPEVRGGRHRRRRHRAKRMQQAAALARTFSNPTAKASKKSKGARGRIHGEEKEM
jgi:hypothetical protein